MANNFHLKVGKIYFAVNALCAARLWKNDLKLVSACDYQINALSGVFIMTKKK